MRSDALVVLNKDLAWSAAFQSIGISVDIKKKKEKEEYIKKEILIFNVY